MMERNPTSSLLDQGAGIIAGNETQSFLERYDHTHRPIGVPCRVRRYLNKKGEEIHREGPEMTTTSWDLLYNILRANFDGAKSDYCDLPKATPGEGEAVYDFGHTVTDIRENEGSIELGFKDRSGNPGVCSADMVLAADGPSSTVRKLLAPEVERTYTGYVAWRGTIPEDIASQSMKDAFVEQLTYFFSEGIQILA